MALTNLEETVLRKAQAEADGVLEKARAEAEARGERESARLRAEHERRVAAMKAGLEADLEREANNRRTADRLKLLGMKNEIIADVFGQAIRGIVALPNDGYAHWLKEQLARLPKVADAEVAANDRDRELMGRLLREVGRDADLSVSGKAAAIQGGFLVQGPQADLDYSLEGLLDVLKESLAQTVTGELFGEETETEEKAEAGDESG